MATKPKLGISLRSLARDASDFEERIYEASNYKPDSIELSCFAQDLILNKKVIVGRAEKMRQSLNQRSCLILVLKMYILRNTSTRKYFTGE